MNQKRIYRTLDTFMLIFPTYCALIEISGNKISDNQKEE